MQWINTEEATIEKARILLANRIADLPIWIRWYRTFKEGRTSQYEVCELIGVTAKRLTVKLRVDGMHHVDPRRCYFPVRREV